MFWAFSPVHGNRAGDDRLDVTLPSSGTSSEGTLLSLLRDGARSLGLFFVIGLGMAVWRRFVQAGARRRVRALRLALALLFVINVTGFVMEACRLAVVEPWWGPWSPVGWALGRGLVVLGLTPGLRGLTSRRGCSMRRSRCSSSRSSRIPISSISSRRPSTSLLEARSARRDPADQEHRGSRDPRHLEARGVLVEAAARLRRVRRVRPLPGGLPGLHVGHGALAQADHRQAQAAHARQAAGPIHGELIKADELWRARRAWRACRSARPSSTSSTRSSTSGAIWPLRGALPRRLRSRSRTSSGRQPWGCGRRALAWAQASTFR